MDLITDPTKRFFFFAFSIQLMILISLTLSEGKVLNGMGPFWVRRKVLSFSYFGCDGEIGFALGCPWYWFCFVYGFVFFFFFLMEIIIFLKKTHDIALEGEPYAMKQIPPIWRLFVLILRESAFLNSGLIVKTLAH